MIGRADKIVGDCVHVLYDQPSNMNKLWRLCAYPLSDVGENSEKPSTISWTC